MIAKWDKNTYIVNSKDEITEFGKWVRARFEMHPYQVFTAKSGLTRTMLQNSKLWPMLADIALQVEYHGNNYDEESWKDILTGSFKKAEFVPTIDGTGYVVLGLHTSKMSVQDFRDLIDFIYAFGAEMGVVWSEESKVVYQGNSKRPKAKA